MMLHDTPLAGLVVVETPVRADARGSFQRLFCAQDLADAGHPMAVVQSNLSVTSDRGTVRGMHFQAPPAAEAKLVRCLRGRVFDVAVDLRAGSSTFLRWHGVELSGDRPVALLIPKGFAHGFQVLDGPAELLYFHSAAWTPDCEGGLRHDDPRLGIAWPLPARNLSERDRSHPLLAPDYPGIPL